MNNKHWFWVYYPASMAFQHDAAIEKAVGRGSDGSGCDIGQPNGERDMDWGFDTAAEADIARTRVMALGIEGLRTKVTPPDTN